MEPVGRLNAELTEQAHDAWRDYAARNGVSVTGLLEALAAEVGGRVDWPAVVEAARVIDSERRARG